MRSSKSVRRTSGSSPTAPERLPLKYARRPPTSVEGSVDPEFES